jgi:hypothetical protein
MSAAGPPQGDRPLGGAARSDVRGDHTSDLDSPPPRWLTAQRIMWIMWPAFLMAGVAELVFFSIFDPFDLHFFGSPLEFSREAVYAMGFFGFWALGITSSALALFLESPPGRERQDARVPGANDVLR